MCTREAASQKPPIEVFIDPGYPGDGTLNLRASSAAADELCVLMDEHGVYAGRVLEHSAATDLAILGASITGGLGGLAAVLRAYFGRHATRKIRFGEGDSTVELSGTPPKETEALVDRFLENARQRKLEQERACEAMEEPPDP